MIADGVPLRTVSQRAGHAQMTTTANIYAHAIQTADEIAAEVLEDILTPETRLQQNTAEVGKNPASAVFFSYKIIKHQINIRLLVLVTS